MRGFRLFDDISDISVEWRIQGFRIRTLLALWVFIGGFIGGTLILVSAWLGGAVLAFVIAVAAMFAVYTYRNDPDLVLGEITMVSLLWKGSRNRYTNNETEED